MHTALKDKLVQAIQLLDEIDDMLENDIVLVNPHDTGEEFSFCGLSIMIQDYLDKSLGM